MAEGPTVTIFHHPRCSKSRAAMSAADVAGVAVAGRGVPQRGLIAAAAVAD